MSLFDRCYPILGSILVLVSFIFCPCMYKQCQLPKYKIENLFDYLKLSMAKTELTISDYKSVHPPMFLSSVTASSIQSASQGGSLRLHSLLSVPPIPQQCYQCYLLISTLHSSTDLEGTGWKAAPDIWKLASVLYKPICDMFKWTQPHRTSVSNSSLWDHSKARQKWNHCEIHKIPNLLSL